MSAKIIQLFPPPPKLVGQDLVDLSREMFDRGVHEAYVSATEDATRFLIAKDPVGYANISTEKQLSAIAFVAMLILQGAALQMRAQAGFAADPEDTS